MLYEQSADKDILALLTDLFKADLGEGHLEHLTVQDADVLNVEMSVQNLPQFWFCINNESTALLQLVAINSTFKELNIQPYYKDFYARSMGLRGPPSQL